MASVLPRGPVPVKQILTNMREMIWCRAVPSQHLPTEESLLNWFADLYNAEQGNRHAKSFTPAIPCFSVQNRGRLAMWNPWVFRSAPLLCYDASVRKRF
jgi:hypothetical protein